MWEEITVADGTTRQLQWTSRVEGDSSVTTSLCKSTHRYTRQLSNKQASKDSAKTNAKAKQKQTP